MAGGTSRSDASLVWFTIGRGVLNEVYYPRIDSPCTRDLYCLVTGPDGFFSDEREDAKHRVEWLAEGVPGFVVTSTCSQGRYRIEKTILTDDRLNVVLQQARFTALKGDVGDYRLHVYLNPHVAGKGNGNTGWVAEFKGRTALSRRAWGRRARPDGLPRLHGRIGRLRRQDRRDRRPPAEWAG